MLKKIAKILIVFFLLLSLVGPVMAQEEKVNIYFFWSKGCPHCVREKTFLAELEKKYESVSVESFNITASQENIILLQKIGKSLKADTSGVPFTVIGEKYFIGFLSDETTGKKMEETVLCALENGCQDFVAELVTPELPVFAETNAQAIPETIHLPLLGKIKTKNFSLPLFTFVIALVDGFNPCAMWVLLFLISLLLGMKDRKRMWLLGSAFIITSGFAYFLFLSAWLNLFLFLGFVFWVRTLVGLVALGAGGYSLRKFVVNKEGGCETVGDEKRQKIFEKMRKITQKKQLLLALGGMILLAFAVNLIELVCSAGLPAIYTQVLTLTKLPKWQYFLYLLFYILIFMLDDLFIFFVAMTALQAIGIQSKYARWSRLIGGVLMLVIGLLLLFKPEFLMFG